MEIMMAVIVHAGLRCVALVGLVGWVVEQWSIMWSGQYDMVCVLSDSSTVRIRHRVATSLMK
jgi:hypothetical protein